MNFSCQRAEAGKHVPRSRTHSRVFFMYILFLLFLPLPSLLGSTSSFLSTILRCASALSYFSASPPIFSWLRSRCRASSAPSSSSCRPAKLVHRRRQRKFNLERPRGGREGKTKEKTARTVRRCKNKVVRSSQVLLYNRLIKLRKNNLKRNGSE